MKKFISYTSRATSLQNIVLKRWWLLKTVGCVKLSMNWYLHIMQLRCFCSVFVYICFCKLNKGWALLLSPYYKLNKEIISWFYLWQLANLDGVINFCFSCGHQKTYSFLMTQGRSGYDCFTWVCSVVEAKPWDMVSTK